MTVGDTLLKLSDFPFAYSLLAILFFSAGTDITKDHYLFLVISGFVATSLAIIDPIGKYVKLGRKRVITNSKKDEETKKYEISALNTGSINLEIEKIVNFIYFVLVLVAFALAVNFAPLFASHLMIKNNDNVTICAETCVKSLGLTIPTIIVLLLILEARQRIIKLKQNIEIMGFYRHSMDLQSATLQSKENLNKAIEQNDWELADWWKSQVTKEIEVEAGLEEQKRKLQIERLEKQFISYGELLTILTMAKMVGIDHRLCKESKKPYILSVPEEENRLREIFAKSKYLFTPRLWDEYSQYEKNKQSMQGTLPATNISHSFSLIDLTAMETIAQSEYDKVKTAYEEITNLEI